MQQLVDKNKELRDILDIDIENMRMLMVKMSQNRHEEKRNIFISRARKQNNNRRYMTKKDCRSKDSGALQQKSLETRGTEDDKDKNKFTRK